MISLYVNSENVRNVPNLFQFNFNQASQRIGTASSAFSISIFDTNFAKKMARKESRDSSRLKFTQPLRTGHLTSATEQILCQEGYHCCCF